MPKNKKIIREWLFGLERWKKCLIQIIFDCLTVPAALFLAFYVRLEKLDFLYLLDPYIGVLLALMPILLIFTFCGLYNSFSRHISLEAAYSIVSGSIVSALVLFAGIFLLELKIPRSVPLIYLTFFCLLSLGFRLFVRITGQASVEKKKTNIAIYGAGEAGIQLMEMLRKNPDYRVRLFIDDDTKLDRKNISGISINTPKNAKGKFKKLQIETLLLAVPSNTDTLQKWIFELIDEHPVSIKTFPSISSLISGKVKIAEMKDIDIEDFLGREPAQYNFDLMAKTIVGKTVLVTGAGGSIGSELCRQIIPWKPLRIIMLDLSEFAIYALMEELKNRSLKEGVVIIPLIGSIQDKQFVKEILSRFNVETIYHAAAYKHVPLMEQNVMQCIKNNVFGTLNIAELAQSAGVSNFTLISTDKAVNPTNFMGASKRLAELICQCLAAEKSGTCFSIVRFGNVLGSSGSVFPLFKKQIEMGGPITLTHPDVTRYFMTIPEAAQLVIQASSLSRGGDIFVLDMGRPVKIIDLAQKMASLAGLRPVFKAKNSTRINEIVIEVSGLRPGEKLHEELSYSECLSKTVHPLINSTFETPLNIRTFRELLANISTSVQESDHQKLHQIIASISTGVVTITKSEDFFIKPNSNSGA